MKTSTTIKWQSMMLLIVRSNGHKIQASPPMTDQALGNYSKSFLKLVVGGGMDCVCGGGGLKTDRRGHKKNHACTRWQIS